MGLSLKDSSPGFDPLSALAATTTTDVDFGDDVLIQRHQENPAQCPQPTKGPRFGG